ncbi:hypothetical protein [Pseudomonas sp. PA-1-3F]|uniref:hypothetical protein n=1 Tax=Pseudomonas sp. PA-1-3F TaxID=2665465 RepID=UPI001F1AA5FA|nr:hypothetical protein [Pseudomonas sp. PA-1-3F]MCF5685749.1 hypothetical protein [Pseudomonas sp. PA-1-3F]
MTAECKDLPIPLQLLAAGAVTSVGMSLSTSAAAIRASLDNFQDTHFFDAQGNSLRGARIPHPAQDDDTLAGGHERLAGLLDMAIEECLHVAGLHNQLPDRATCILLCPEQRSSYYSGLAATCLQRSLAHYHPSAKPYYGHIGGEATDCATALSLAAQVIHTQHSSHVLLLSVDSWLNTPDIAQALREDRLLTEDQPSGFIPGEAAVALLLGPSTATPDNQPSGLQIVGSAQAQEPATLLSQAPCYGKGLATAIKAALAQAGIQAHEVDLRLADLAGEEFFFEESSYAWSRLLRADLPANHQFIQPANSLGNIGAAFGPLMLAYAWHLSRIGRAPGANTLIQLSTPQQARAALVVRVV